MTRPRLPSLADDDDDGFEPSDATRLFEVDKPPTQSTAQTPCFVVTSGQSALGMIFRIRGEMSIGRTVGCDILLAEDDVSRSHATVTDLPDGRLRVVDVASSNGLWLRGRRVEQAILGEGDKIQIGRATLSVVLMDDVDETIQRNLFETSTRDPVSGLYNRRYFLEMLRWEFSHRPQSEVPIALVRFGIDDFALRRDSFGQSALDSIVRRVAAVTQETVQAPEAVAARVGDAEVALLLPGSSSSEAASCAEWIRASIARSPFKLGAGDVTVTLSAGVVVGGRAGFPSAEQLLAASDQALCGARAAGGDRVLIVAERG